MLIAPEALIDGVLRTLEEEVLPHVEGAFARGQLHSAIDVLANLRDRIEEKAALHAADAEAAALALSQALAPLAAAGAASELERALASAPAGPPAARAAALRELVSAALRTGAPGVEDALRGYLVGQAVRDVLPLKRSRLGEIAKG
jgi:hypothetical protein